MRTHGVNQAIWFVEGIWLHRKSHQPVFFGKGPCLYHTCATLNEQPTNIKTMYACKMAKKEREKMGKDKDILCGNSIIDKNLQLWVNLMSLKS